MKWPRKYRRLFSSLVGQFLNAARQEDRIARVGLQDQTDYAKIQRRGAGQIVDARQSAEEPGERSELHRDRTLEQHARQAIRIELERARSGIRLHITHLFTEGYESSFGAGMGIRDRFGINADFVFATRNSRISNLLSQILRLVISWRICWLAHRSESGLPRRRGLRRLRRALRALRATGETASQREKVSNPPPKRTGRWVFSFNPLPSDSGGTIR